MQFTLLLDKMKISSCRRTVSGGSSGGGYSRRIHASGKIVKNAQFISFGLCLLAMQFTYASIYSGSKDGLSVSTTTVLRYHKPGELVFSEEFFELDPSIWYNEVTPPGDKNGEFQAYEDAPENSYVRDGILYIRPTYSGDPFREDFFKNASENLTKRKRASRSHDDIFKPVTSARLNTRRAFAFQNGQLEIRAKLPEGDWIWPALWLLPQQNRYGLWPTSGEIDIMESRGNRELLKSNGEDIGSNQFGSTLHFGMNRTTDRWRLAHYTRTDKNGWNSQFHTYGIVWSPDEISFTLDGDVIGTVTPPSGGFWEMGNFTGPKIWTEDKMSPFDQPFYIILNVAVGGTFGFFPDNTGPKRKPWTNNSPTAMLDFWEARNEWQPTWKGEDSALQVDYIRVWAL